MTPLNNSTVAHDCVLSGTPPILIICSATTASLSGASREFVRELRSGGTRVEFHAPGDADALLQSANRLLAEIPLESLLGSAQSYPPHLLIIDDAESLSLAEAAALRRIVQGLRGSAFRTMLLVRQTKAGMARLPLSEILDIAMVWDVDGTDDAAVQAESIPVIEEPVVIKTDAPVLPREPDEPMPDVLAELARERAESRGFDVTISRRWIAKPAAIALVVVAFIAVGFGLVSIFAGKAETAPLVYNCGLHPDQESVDVLLARIGRTTPTRVTSESGKFRLQVGPFATATAADAARSQVWRLGACRVEPSIDSSKRLKS